MIFFVNKIAFGMNTDAVIQKESILNSYLSKILQILMKNAFDPFMRVKETFLKNI